MVGERVSGWVWFIVGYGGVIYGVICGVSLTACVTY